MKDMGVTLQQWIDFLDIDQEIIDTLRDFFPILAPRIDRVSHAFYRRVLNSPEAIKLFADEDSANRALAHQKRHWLEYVFADGSTVTTWKRPCAWVRPTSSEGWICASSRVPTPSC